MSRIGDSSPSSRSGTVPRTGPEHDEIHEDEFAPITPAFLTNAAEALDGVDELLRKAGILVAGFNLLGEHVAELTAALQKHPEEFAAMKPHRDRLLTDLNKLLKDLHA